MTLAEAAEQVAGVLVDARGPAQRKIVRGSATNIDDKVTIMLASGETVTMQVTEVTAPAE